SCTGGPGCWAGDLFVSAECGMRSAEGSSMSRTPQIALGIGFGVFLAIIVLLLAPTVSKPKVMAYAPTPAGVTRPAEGRLVNDTITVDAGDEQRWRFVDLDRGA